MAAIVVLIAVNANAQFGFKFGYVSQSNKFSYEETSLKPKAQNGAYAGFFYDIATPVKGLSVRPALLYTYVGGKSILADDLDYSLGVSASKIKDRSHSVSVPIDIKYAYSITNDFKIYAFAGPRAEVGIAYLVTAKEGGNKISLDLYSGKIKGKSKDGKEISETNEDGGIASRLDVKLGLGAGVQYKKVSLEVGYDWGLLNRIKSDYTDGDSSLKRSNFVVGLGFAF